MQNNKHCARVLKKKNIWTGISIISIELFFKIVSLWDILDNEEGKMYLMFPI